MHAKAVIKNEKLCQSGDGGPELIGNDIVLMGDGLCRKEKERRKNLHLSFPLVK
jgi:hypothetical protein